jgi:hypothetical protein
MIKNIKNQIYTRLNWLRTGFIDGILWTRYWTLLLKIVVKLLGSLSSLRYQEILYPRNLLSKITRKLFCSVLILWRVSVAPLIIVGSWSLISIYWITHKPCNYPELPQLQCFHSSQPIITMSYIMDTASWLFPSWLLSEHCLKSPSESESELYYDRRSVGQSVLEQSTIWGLRPDFYYCLTIAVFLYGSPSLTRGRVARLYP